MTAPRPNIIVILVDDMGFSDIGCYGSEIATPNLNRLAGGGMAFTQMYNCARCCPTRASLLTGLYPHQAGVGAMVKDFGRPGYRGFLNDRCLTIAEALKPAGYRTFMSGKWHVGGNYNVQQPETWAPGDAGHPTPLQRGFDEHYGTLCGAGSYWFPPTLSDNGTFVEPDSPEFYLTHALSDRACEMIGRADDAGDPFFLYLAYTAPHWPLHAPKETIENYRGRYRQGWDALRTARHEQLKGSGILDAKWPISPRDPQAPPWQDVDDKDTEDIRMAAYAAMVEEMDRGVGRVLDTLDQRRIAENTLVMFLSDNGGCHEFIGYGSNWAQRLRRQTLDGREVTVGNKPGLDPGPDTTYQSYGRPWANASNTPFRLHKHWVHEGGISTPLLAYWPGKIAPGSRSGHLSHVVDIMPTCLAAAGANYPDANGESPVHPLDGESLLDVFTGAEADTERCLFWEHEGNKAVRHGRWKLVAVNGGPWELYDMVEDRTELNDLSAVQKELADRLTGEYDHYADTHHVVPREEITKDWP
jgi:arylsulfatase